MKGAKREPKKQYDGKTASNRKKAADKGRGSEWKVGLDLTQTRI